MDSDAGFEDLAALVRKYRESNEPAPARKRSFIVEEPEPAAADVGVFETFHAALGSGLFWRVVLAYTVFVVLVLSFLVTLL